MNAVIGTFQNRRSIATTSAGNVAGRSLIFQPLDFMGKSMTKKKKTKTAKKNSQSTTRLLEEDLKTDTTIPLLRRCSTPLKAIDNSKRFVFNVSLTTLEDLKRFCIFAVFYRHRIIH